MKAAVRTVQRKRTSRVLGILAVGALLASTACEADKGDDSADGHTASGRPSATGSATSENTASAEPDKTKPARTAGGSSAPTGKGNGNGHGKGKGGDGKPRTDGKAACAPSDLAFTTTNQDEGGAEVRHLLLTATNVGHATCTVYGHPLVRLGADAQAPVALIKESDPKALATLAPGDEANAALLVMGGARDTYEAHSISVVLQGRKPGSTASGPIDVKMPGVDTLTVDDGGRVTYWMTPSGLALDFIMSL